MAFKGNPALAGLSAVEADYIQFLMYSDEDIKGLSVVKVTNNVSFDLMGNPSPGGLYDPAMGPGKDRHELCQTCSNTQFNCPGHFGHIELPILVVNPLFFKTIYTLFRISCLKCFKIQMSEKTKTLVTLQLQLINKGHVTAALDLEALNSGTEFSESAVKVLHKYNKLLKKVDPTIEVFQSKNTDVLRKRILSNYIKAMSIARKCIYCRNKMIKIKTSDNKFMQHHTADSGKGIKILMPDEIQNNCYAISNNNEDILPYFIPILQHSSDKPLTKMFFMENILVPPPNIRPINFLRGELLEHPQSVMYKAILNTALQIRVILQVLSSSEHEVELSKMDQRLRLAYESAYGTQAIEKLHNAWQALQKNVNLILSCNNGSTGGRGIKEILEKKTGMIRMNMMGKRVNFAARSVITPDPNVDIDEIGIPDAFAKKLTFPVPVNEWNVEELRKMVINGPDVHPGAHKIEIENGRVILIPADSIQKRKSLAKRLLTPDEYKSSSLKIVHRHLVNGDVLLLNRQPSLHRPSMMAHRARILKGEKTLRLHYANCKSYNADFDGDEMNAHFPQNEIARSEAYNIMSVCKNYLVPKDGTPLSGLIQDHVISGVKMSLRGTFFGKSDYQQLVYQALGNHRGPIKLLPPAIIKPNVLWSGKQVLSTIIINNIPKDKPYLSLTSKAKIGAKNWQKFPPRKWLAGGTPFPHDNTMTEAEVVIQKGELLCGVLDKTHYGATPYGLIHCMYELYGGRSSSGLLSSFSKVFTYYLQWIGFTLGVQDILVVDDANKKRDEYIALVRDSGRIAAAKATELPLDVDDDTLRLTIADMLTKDPKFRTTLDRQYKSMLDEYTNKINKACLIDGLLEKFPSNNLQLMVESGAKGSTVNTMQISCLLGQIELEGKRPPLMISGKSLPSFTAYDTSPRAGGFIDGRFLTGIQPQEFFFHCMAGREGLIDTAVKTSRSGYLQRCLVKHLEGLSVGYDHTVRDSDGSVIQFAFGEDGLDILKCQYLNPQQMPFLDTNSSALIQKSNLDMLKEDADPKAVKKSQKSIKKWKKSHEHDSKNPRNSGFTEFCRLTKDDIDIKHHQITKSGRDPRYEELERRWRELDEEEKKPYNVKPCPEPIQSKTAPHLKLGVLNEKLDGIIEQYLKNRHTSPYSSVTEKDKFVEILSAKYLASMADPGEPVGLLAAQSLGEPSTQMTLNTFHFAGRGDMNVTLGIPRLREILMTASANLKTPNMDIPFRELPDAAARADRLRLQLNRVTVADVLQKIDVKCEVVTSPERQLKTTMRYVFLPRSQYRTRYAIKPKQIIKHMETNFFNDMFIHVRRHAKNTTGVVWSADKVAKRGKGELEDEEQAPAAEEASSDEEEATADDDNTDARLRSKRAEGLDYEDPESEDEEKSDDELQEMSGDDEPPRESGEDLALTLDSKEESGVNHDVVRRHHGATDYTFDAKKHLWCELTVLFPISYLKVDLTQALRDAATKSVVSEVKRISRAVVDLDPLMLRTEGINIPHMFRHDQLLDVNRLYSNDVHAIANTYGIEAATKVIIKEIQSVFRVYGIAVDPRHLALVADYMTYNGVFEPMSRKGMESSSSPLQQMSFESSLTFLREAVLGARRDLLQSASSSLMLGQPCKAGTGCFDLLTKLMTA